MVGRTDHQMDFDKMQAMAKQFDNAAKQLEETQSQMKKVAKSLEDGGLKGQAGVAFSDAINSKLLPAVQRLNEKLVEMATDIRQNEAKVREAVGAAAKHFKN